MHSETFGGYFPLELNLSEQHYYPTARGYRSARSALYHLLTEKKTQRLWLPRLICQSVIEAVKAARVEIAWYTLDDALFPQLPAVLAESDFVLFVDYMGHCQPQKEKLMRLYPAGRIIFDHAQSFYNAPEPVFATVYSPRKFFGVADGGLLVTQDAMPLPASQDRHSFTRMTHLLLQHEYGTRAGYEDFQHAETALEDIEASRMSALTEKLLLSVNYQKIKAVRQRNYMFLRQQLASINASPFFADDIAGPFCYPLYFTGKKLRPRLIEQGIFVASYWQEVLNHVSEKSVEADYVNYMVPLPCDQRYEIADLKVMSQRVLDVIAGK